MFIVWIVVGYIVPVGLVPTCNRCFVVCHQPLYDCLKQQAGTSRRNRCVSFQNKHPGRDHYMLNTAGLCVLCLKGQGHQGISSLVKDIL